jgi:hypothetical protein
MVKFRFAYVFTGGSYYPQTSTGVGLYLDNIAVSNAELLLGTVITAIPSGTSFAFSPTSTNTTYLLQARAHINSRTLPWGPAFGTSVVTPPPAIQLLSKPTLTAGQIQVDFNVSNYRSGMTFQLWKSPTANTGYTQDASAVLTTLTANSKYRFSTATGSVSRAYYRIKGLY